MLWRSLENYWWYANFKAKSVRRNSIEIKELICFCFQENKWYFWSIFIRWSITIRPEYPNIRWINKWDCPHLRCHKPRWFWFIAQLIQFNPKLNVQDVYLEEWSIFNQLGLSQFKVIRIIQFYSFRIALLALLLSKEFNVHKPFFNGWFIFDKLKTDWFKLFITIYKFIRRKQISFKSKIHWCHSNKHFAFFENKREKQEFSYRKFECLPCFLKKWKIFLINGNELVFLFIIRRF